MKKKYYWFSLYPSCFLWLKGGEGLVYNAENKAKVLFRATGMVATMAGQLAQPENLYVIRLDEEQCQDSKLKTWMEELVAKGCGVLVPDDGQHERPLSLPPVLRVQDEAEYYRWEHRQGIDGNVLDNLHKLVFHLNGSRHGHDDYTRQWPLYPTVQPEALAVEDVRRFARNARLSPFLTEIVLTGNPFAVDRLPELVQELQEICPVTVCCMRADALEHLEEARAWATSLRLDIAVTDYSQLETLPREASLTCLVASETDWEQAAACEEQGGFRAVSFVPVYTGDNATFLESGLYIHIDDLMESTPDKREIFIRQKLNLYDFGRLVVMPDGLVYANPNAESLGSIHDSPHQLAYREITEGHSWLRVREGRPCCDCIYQWLCPSPSCYEQVLGRADLCGKY